MKRLAIVAPGFSADCLETLEELDIENRAVFLANGGEKFTFVPCLNDSEPGQRVIEHVVRRELMGWLYAGAAHAVASHVSNPDESRHLPCVYCMPIVIPARCSYNRKLGSVAILLPPCSAYIRA